MDSVNAQLRSRGRKQKSERTPPRSEQKRIAALARKRWKAFGTCIGQKRKNGRWLRQVVVVCLTREKLRGAALPKRRRVPRQHSWTERGRRFRISTDVLQANPRLELQSGAILGPGDQIRFNGEAATIGAVIDHPDLGLCITTAGHLFNGPEDEGSLAEAISAGQVVRIRLQKCVLLRSRDYALLTPRDECDCDNLFQDVIRIGPAYTPVPEDVGRELFVLDGVQDSVVTVCRGINARLKLTNGLYENVILCDGVTHGGQSGAALVDSDNRLWGFLLGSFDRFSIFMPAEVLLRMEQSQLA